MTSVLGHDKSSTSNIVQPGALYRYDMPIKIMTKLNKCLNQWSTGVPQHTRVS